MTRAGSNENGIDIAPYKRMLEDFLSNVLPTACHRARLRIGKSRSPDQALARPPA